MDLQDTKRVLRMWRDIESRVRSFFIDRGFEEVRTPLLVPVPGMEPNLSPFSVDVELHNPTRQKKGYLITSPEYSMKKLLGSGLEKIFTITPVFRNSEHAGGVHYPEFTMLEWYAPGGYHELMNETEELLHYVLESDTLWPRISYKEASVDDDGEPHAEADQFFLTEYPPGQAALAKLSKDGTYAERFEAYAGGIELCNGFAELTDSAEQRRRFEREQDQHRKLGNPVPPIDEQLLASLDRIKKPIYGNALGVDRLLMLKYGVSDIRDIQLINPWNE